MSSEYNQDKGFEMVTKVNTRQIYKKEGYDGQIRRFSII
jgi:hypothetical protein